MLSIKLYCIQTKERCVTLCRYWSHGLSCSRPAQSKFNFSNFVLVLFVYWKMQWNVNEKKIVPFMRKCGKLRYSHRGQR